MNLADKLKEDGKKYLGISAVASTVLLSGCGTPSGDALFGSLIFRGAATNPNNTAQQAAAWSILGQTAETAAIIEGQKEAVREGAAQANINDNIQNQNLSVLKYIYKEPFSETKGPGLFQRVDADGSIIVKAFLYSERDKNKPIDSFIEGEPVGLFLEWPYQIEGFWYGVYVFDSYKKAIDGVSIPGRELRNVISTESKTIKNLPIGDYTSTLTLRAGGNKIKSYSIPFKVLPK